jgi:outer membrane lipoprotein-sorting protein
MRPLIVALVSLFVGSALAATPAVDDILKRVDANLTYDTRESTTKMTVTKGDRVKVYRLHSFGKGADIGAVEYLEPARDKGTRMLRKSDELWMYMPSVEKTQKISGHMLRQSMMGSDMSYEDMMQAASWMDMYDGQVVGEESVDGRKCWKLDVKAVSADVAYPRRVLWVDQETSIPLKQELYALSGMLLKTWTMGDIVLVGSRQVARRMVIEDKVQAGSKTELVIEDIKFAIPLQDEVFTTRWLER